MASPAILSSFLGQQGTQNHPQYFSGLSRALFPTTFLEIADKNKQTNKTKQKQTKEDSPFPRFTFLLKEVGQLYRQHFATKASGSEQMTGPNKSNKI